MFKTDFIKNIFFLVSGTAVAQAIPILISPILTRIYSPESFGIFSVYLGMISVLSVIASARYELAIVLPEKDEDAFNIVAVSFIIVLCFSIVILFVFLVFRSLIVNLLGNERIGEYFPLVSLSIFLIGFYQILNNWLVRVKMFKAISISKIGQAVSNSVAKLSFGFFQMKDSGLILGDIVGQVAILVILFKQSFKNLKDIFRKISIESMIFNSIRYSNFPKFYLITALLDSFTISYPIFIISKNYGSETTGYFGLMSRIISIPSTIIATAVSQVYFQKIVELKNSNKRIKQFVIKTMIFLFLIALPISIILFFGGPFLFKFVFGEKWVQAGEYASILSFAFLVRFVASPLSMIFPGLEKIRVGALWQSLCFITTIITLYFAKFFNIKTFLVIFCLHDVFLYGFYLFLIIKVASYNFATKNKDVK